MPNGWVEAGSYDEIIVTLLDVFRTRYPKRPGRAVRAVRMVGLLFARPHSPLAAAEITPNLEYFHHRSGNNFDFFAAGYPRLSRQLDAQSFSRMQWRFSAEAFDELRKKVESKTTWRYSGGVDLILTNALYNPKTGTAHLDFRSAIAVNLDAAKAERAIQSVETFFEKICQYAEGETGDDPTWGFSDKMGLRIARSALKELVISLLPKALQSGVRKATHFVVVDCRQVYSVAVQAAILRS